VLADLFYPGWEATIDGVPTAISRANYLFRGVPVPAGKSEVVFEYRPRSVRYGLAVSAVVLTAMVAYAAYDLRRRRRRSPVPAAQIVASEP
jgi:uncharacterized membrane protein YfhO